MLIFIDYDRKESNGCCDFRVHGMVSERKCHEEKNISNIRVIYYRCWSVC